MPTLQEAFENAMPAAKWIFENIREHADGPFEALIAIEIAKRSMLATGSLRAADFEEKWREFEKELDGLTLVVHRGCAKDSLEFQAFDKPYGDA